MAALITPAASAAEPGHKDHVFSRLFRQTNGWSAGDGAISIPLSDGRVLWLFGDSYMDQFDAKSGTVPCLFDARNAVMLQTNKDILRWQPLRNPDGGKSFFHPPGTAAGVPWPCLWPGAGFQWGDLIYIYTFEMQQKGNGGNFGFTKIGQFWAKLSFPDLRIAGYTPLPEANGVGFWCGFVPDAASNVTYAYGNKQNGISSDVYVARFPTRNPEAAWTFWDGRKWDVNPTNAAAIAQGASYSVQVSKVNGKFLLTSTAFSVACDQGKEIYIATSDSPTGPFSRRRRVFTVDDTVDGHYPFFYAAEAHPEFINAGGELLITYSINGYEPCLPNCVNGRMNPDYYRPRAIRVPMVDF